MSTQAEANRWNAPEFGAPRAAPARPEAAPAEPLRIGPSVEELAAIEKAARDEGYAEGHKQGLAAGQAEVQRLQQQLDQLVRAFAQPLAGLDREVADALGTVAVRIAGELLGEAYAADPARLERLVDTALASIAEQRVGAEVHLHPADLALLNKEVDRGGARLLADGALKRGDLRVHTPSLRIDGSLEARLQGALAALRFADDGSAG